MNKQKFDVNKLRVATPCSMKWDAMTGDERKRFCDSCERNVFNIAQLNENEIHSLVTKSKQERVCVKLYRRADGTVLTRDCPVGRRGVRRRIASFASATLAMVLSLFSASYAQSQKDKDYYKPKVRDGMFRGETGFRDGLLKGTIIDQTGYAVTDVTVTVLNIETGKKLISKTNKKGRYQIPLLSTGNYSIEITPTAGFQGAQRTVTVNKNEAVEFNVILNVGTFIGIIDIEDENSVVDTTSSGTTHRISREMIDKLPHE